MKVGDLVRIYEDFCAEDGLICVITKKGSVSSFGKTLYFAVPVDESRNYPPIWVTDDHVAILSGE